MNKYKQTIVITLSLGILSLIAMAFSHLALTDIAHGEADVSLEWTILRVTALTLLTFIGATFFTLFRVLKLRS
ncbi:hypothetical protein GW866_01335 [bacterium]|nr:hypothetical protein [bacterium]OIO90010.1 MAG: hypothetical protein AUK02_01670 [Anaerolineae bacterium CG2_30_58_95]PIU91519.1 MAG: hypothetical protein COS63_00900 [Anaerolineae bacterium CG06_land_8_20_14_3_00_57_67]PIW20795.1 MAG: hypothetical protein COW33_01065 [Anaerolineae bacterium CG17_big_fil_post_rev_8_21_14_2_50_57_27]PJH75064.1 MAG: hypothetical protein CO064_08650 [Anaerolineae bacterium CG_4_9_14_0_8_um_filter_58_9]